MFEKQTEKGFIGKGKGVQSREKFLGLGIGFSTWPWAAQPSDIKGDTGDLFMTFFLYGTELRATNNAPKRNNRRPH